MATWSSKKKSLYISIFFLLIIIVVGGVGFLFFYKKPTCSDGLMNGKETGIDCGGVCPRICQDVFLPAKTVWVREDKISSGVYNMGAYIENQNLDGFVKKADYVFKLYDSSGFIAERYGSVYIPPHKNILIFEKAINTGQRTPSKFNFEFINKPFWEKFKDQEPIISVVDRKVYDEGAVSKSEAVIKNQSLDDYENIEVFAILYGLDSRGDEITLGFSKTIIDQLPKNSSATAYFTWPTAKANDVVRVEIIPVVKL